MRVPKIERREVVLRDVLLNGPSWETSSAVLIAAVRKKSAFKTFTKKMVGSKAARRLGL